MIYPTGVEKRIKRTHSIDKLEIEFRRKIEWQATGEKSHRSAFNAYKWDCRKQSNNSLQNQHCITNSHNLKVDTFTAELAIYRLRL